MPKRPKPNDPELAPPPSVVRLQGFVSELSLRAGVGIASSKSTDFSDEIVGRSLAVMEGVTAHDVRVTARRHQIEGEDLREVSDWLEERIEAASAPTIVYFDEAGKEKAGAGKKTAGPAEEDLDRIVAEQVARRLRERGRPEVADAMQDFLLRILAGRLEAAHLREFTSWLENRGKPSPVDVLPVAAGGFAGSEGMPSLVSLTKRRGPELDLAIPTGAGEHVEESPWRLERVAVPSTATRPGQESISLRPRDREEPPPPRSPAPASMKPIPEDQLDPRLAVRDTSRSVWRSNISMAGGFGGILYGERTGALAAISQQPAAGAAALAQPAVSVQATPLLQPQARYLGTPGYGDGHAGALEAFSGQPGGTGLASLDGAVLNGAPGPRFPFGGEPEFGGASMIGVLPSGTPLYLPPHVAALLQQQYGAPQAMGPFPALPGAIPFAPTVLYAASMAGPRGDATGEPAPGFGMPTRVSPTFAQVTVLAPPARVVSPDLQARGAAIEFDWQSLVRQAGPVDAGGLEQMKALLPPGAQIVYPAIHPSRLPRGAVNVNLTQEVASDLAGKAYGPAAAQVSKSAAFAAHASTGGTPPAAPLQASFVPGIAPLGGLLGPGATSALGPKAGSDPMKEGAVRPELDFMGLKMKLAPQLGATPDVGAAVALQRPPSVFAKSIKPEQFSEAKLGLLRSAHDVDVQADPSKWAQAAPSFGLKSKGPKVDAELKPGATGVPAPPPVSLPRMDVASPFVPSTPLGMGGPGAIPPIPSAQSQMVSAKLPPIKPFAPPAVASPMTTPAAAAPATPAEGPLPAAKGGPPLAPTNGAAPTSGTPLAATVKPAMATTQPMQPTMQGAKPGFGLPLTSTMQSAMPGAPLKPFPSGSDSGPPKPTAPLSPELAQKSSAIKPSIGITPTIGAAPAAFKPISPTMTAAKSPAALPLQPQIAKSGKGGPGQPIVGSFQKAKTGPPMFPSPDFGAGAPGPPATPTPPPSLPSAGAEIQPRLELPDLKSKTGGAKIGSMVRSAPPTPDKLYPSLPSLFQSRQPKPMSVQRADSGATRGVVSQEGSITPESSADRGSGPNEISMLANEVWTILKRRLDREGERRGRW